MVKENIIPIENKKPVEIVYELKDCEIKKSPLSPAARNKIIKRHGSDYLSERAFNHDIALTQMYGPGFWDEIGSPVTKFLVSAGASALIVGTGGAAAPIVLTGAALAGGGKIAKEIGKETDCEVLEWIGDTVCDTGIGTLTGSLVGGSSSLASHIGNSGKDVSAVVSGTMRTAKFSHDVYGKVELGTECTYRVNHRKHQERGISYNPNCPVCTKSWPFN
jgi:hypothetical protein